MTHSMHEISRVLGSSFGTQPKRLENGYWYKQDQKGYEGLAEYLVSQLLSCSNVSWYVDYEIWKTDDFRGCRSKDFLQGTEQFISFARLYQMHTGREMAEELLLYQNVKERIRFAVHFIEDTVGFDVTEYLQKILSLDALTLNTDRHLNNLGVLLDPEAGTVRSAPIFDNGAALLSDFSRFDPYEDMEKNIEKAKGKPFYSDLLVQAEAVGFGLKINYEKAFGLLDKEPVHRATEVLAFQLKKYEKLFRM